jgi:toxin ParE1/3/4
MAFRVVLAEDAERDVEDIYRHVAINDSVISADRVLGGLEKTMSGLAKMPARGNVPKELHRIGITEFREAHYKPYRIIYRIEERRVVIYCVADGRRDMQSLIRRRLLR